MTDLKNLSLACQLLNSITIPVIFESINYKCLVIYNEGNCSTILQRMRDDLQQTANALKEFAETPKYSPLVRKLTVSYSCQVVPITPDKPVFQEKKTYKTFLDAFIVCLERFPNLKNVEIRGLQWKINKKMLDALARRCPLDAITFTGLSFGPHNIQQLISAKRICIDCRDTFKPVPPISRARILNVFSGENLESLAVWSAPYARRLFRALAECGRLERLAGISVCIRAEDLVDFYALLPSCPNVKRMQVRLVGDGPCTPPSQCGYLKASGW